MGQPNSSSSSMQVSYVINTSYSYCQWKLGYVLLLSHITLYNVCSVHRGKFSTWGVFSTSGDTMSTSEGYLEASEDVQYIGGYHYSCGGASS